MPGCSLGRVSSGELTARSDGATWKVLRSPWKTTPIMSSTFVDWRETRDTPLSVETRMDREVAKRLLLKLILLPTIRRLATCCVAAVFRRTMSPTFSIETGSGSLKPGSPQQNQVQGEVVLSLRIVGSTN